MHSKNYSWKQNSDLVGSILVEAKKKIKRTKTSRIFEMSATLLLYHNGN